MTPKTVSSFAHTLSDWFAANGRDLPWRHTPTPYQVWVSELMLQQTQVVTVIPYYQRWMNRFPTVESLAAASLEDVNTLWAGLGYYRRAQYLHRGARYVVERYGGKFPPNVADLQKITGIGAYTAGAIASFAFGQDEPAIDGNAERVLSRFFGIYGDLSRGDSRQQLESVARDAVSIGGGAVINQAIMDLGATVCRKKALCDLCPIRSHCYAHRNGLTESLPQKKIKPIKWLEYRAAMVIESKDHRYLVAQRKSDELLGNLWEFPMLTIFKEREDNPAAANEGMLAARRPRQKQWRSQMGAINPALQSISCRDTDIEITHIFTHIRMHVLADCAKVTQSANELQCTGGDYERYAWLTFDEILVSPISTMMKKLVHRVSAAQIIP